ncbi:MAG TPA: (Fe-S)-binding protein [Candidatus Lokiarchaeia archaeon]|nr:(Fe-S)-binding protein [Candidatus Lokiarchaeia archaeon]
MALKGKYSCPISEATCPLLHHSSGFEVLFARGRFSLARALLKETVEPSEGLANIFYQCTLCGGCHEVCNNCENADWVVPARENIGDHVEIWEAMRADLVDAGVAPMPQHKEILESIKDEHNPYFQAHGQRLDWMPQGSEAVTEGAETLFFVGCTGAYKLAEMPQNLIEILNKSDSKIAIAPDEWCCGSVALRCGDEQLGKELAEHNTAILHQMGIKKIVATCSGCYRTFKIDYPKILGKENFDFQVMHAIELVDELIQNGQLQINNKLDAIITYHDPCHLGRHARIFDAPRRVIEAINQSGVKEMRRNRQYAYCCGAGGGVKSGFPDLALEIAQERIQEAEETGAKYLATTCPFCIVNLRDAAQSLGSQIEVVDLLELVKKAI